MTHSSLPRRRALGLLAASLASGAWPAWASDAGTGTTAATAATAGTAGAWPTRPLTAIVPFAPGGAGNGSLRILAELIGPRIGQPIVVDNRPGAGGITGTLAVTSSHDDHMLLLGSTTMTILPALRNDLGYDVQRDLQPVGMISTQPLVLAVAANSPLHGIDDLVAKGRAGELSAGNSGVGTLSHLATELLNQKLGARILAVPYKGDSVLIPDVVAGTVSLGVMNLPVALPLIQAGRLRAVAVTSAQPLASLPGVPVLRSRGDEFVIAGWAALFAAKKVPAAGVERLGQLLREALDTPSVRERFAGFGVTPQASTPAQLRAFVRSETARWGELVRGRGIKLE
ncbi:MULTISPECIES: tripartite tricarboxylate transporter substrate binding protein [unclassified Variovorax]|uniref:Bug family tripartite tricarboxylate transporter substrate binding protein n=1 Tax=unclassified Variovorax TaxID=663243 RepID=UPI0008B5F3C4|nr:MULTISPECIES: tripartite tricarboxylate transporter substrate binding protein [unclassified Variovorax]SEK15106.1 Tripartite-type tricarboxylate transporter, receptor component TctC [Variovorax sp. OK202]SFE08931.1 Tripartite-type tricarboxylate transporter, receptor component TctC [Variovorax sp. OK212]